jgi:spore coat protein A, manganese oxidase
MISAPIRRSRLVEGPALPDNPGVSTRRRKLTTAWAAALTATAAVAVALWSGPASGALPTTTEVAATTPSSAQVTIKTNGLAGFTFDPTSVTVAAGGTLTVVNTTTSKHTFTSVAVNASGDPLFNVKVGPSDTVDVPISTLGGGDYDFYCQIHPEMQGTLHIDGPPAGDIKDHPRFEQPLAQPPRLTGKHIRIVMKRAKVRVLPHGPRTPMWTYGGTFPGPTIVRRTGHGTHVTFVNRLPRRAGAVTIHQHGGHQRSRDDGQPMDYLIRHGHERTYDYPLKDAGRPLPASLRFYHDHRMNRTARNNWFGLQGMFLTTDPRDARMGLPHGRFDLPLDFTDRSFTTDNRLTNPFRSRSGMGGMTDAPMGTVGTKVLVNGRFAPYKRVKPGLYRLRLLNTSLFSSYDFALSDGRPFVQIGTGSGLLPHPVVRPDILLGPAQRADVVVDFRRESGKHVMLSSIPRSDGSTTGTGSRQAGLMMFRVRGSTGQRAHVPSTLTHIARLDLPRRIAKTWTFGLTSDGAGTYWSINGKRFDPTRVDHRVVLGHVEKWKLRNTTDMTHYVHLHEELWQTISRDGMRPPPWERGYEDTWRLDPGETVVVAARFTDYTGDFMIHCHMLDHEDDGMMATFRVVRKKR